MASMQVTKLNDQKDGNLCLILEMESIKIKEKINHCTIHTLLKPVSSKNKEKQLMHIKNTFYIFGMY